MLAAPRKLADLSRFMKCPLMVYAEKFFVAPMRLNVNYTNRCRHHFVGLTHSGLSLSWCLYSVWLLCSLIFHFLERQCVRPPKFFGTESPSLPCTVPWSDTASKVRPLGISLAAFTVARPLRLRFTPYSSTPPLPH